MRRHCHNRTGAITNEHVIGNENRDFFAVDRIDRTHTVEFYAGFLFCELRTFKITFLGRFRLISFYLIHIADPVCPLLNGRMLRRNDHVSCSEQGIRTGRVNQQLVSCSGFKLHLSTMAAANPVFLLSFYAGNVIQIIQIVHETVRISGDFQHPLTLDLVCGLSAAPLTLAVHNLFVCQYYLTGRAPVHVHLFFISQTLFVQLQEDPLGPFVIIGIGGIDLTVPIKRQTKAFQLAFKASHIFSGDDFRMDVVFHRIVFRGQAKCIPAHGVQHIIALQPFFTRHNIQRCIAARMAYMQALSGRIRKFYQCVVFRKGIILFGRKGMFLVPNLLPFLLDLFKIVLHIFHIQKRFIPHGLTPAYLPYSSTKSSGTFSPSAQR